MRDADTTVLLIVTLGIPARAGKRRKTRPRLTAGTTHRAGEPTAMFTSLISQDCGQWSILFVC